MSELTNIHARAVKDLTTPTELPADPNALDQVKLVAGNFPAEYAGNEAMTVGMIKELAAQGREEEIADVIQKITDVETKAKEADNLLNTKKTDKTYVDYELSLKAPQSNTYTKSEVDSALSLKAPQATTYNKTEINYLLSDLSTTANKFYPTLAEANANIANIAVKQSVTIGEAANSGLWYKATTGATSLTKSPYDIRTTILNEVDFLSNQKFQDSIKNGVYEVGDLVELTLRQENSLNARYSYIDPSFNPTPNTARACYANPISVLGGTVVRVSAPSGYSIGITQAEVIGGAVTHDSGWLEGEKSLKLNAATKYIGFSVRKNDDSVFNLTQLNTLNFKIAFSTGSANLITDALSKLKQKRVTERCKAMEFWNGSFDPNTGLASVSYNPRLSRMKALPVVGGTAVKLTAPSGFGIALIQFSELGNPVIADTGWKTGTIELTLLESTKYIHTNVKLPNDANIDLSVLDNQAFTIEYTRRSELVDTSTIKTDVDGLFVEEVQSQTQLSAGDFSQGTLSTTLSPLQANNTRVTTQPPIDVSNYESVDITIPEGYNISVIQGSSPTGVVTVNGGWRVGTYSVNFTDNFIVVLVKKTDNSDITPAEAGALGIVLNFTQLSDFKRPIRNAILDLVATPITETGKVNFNGVNQAHGGITTFGAPFDSIDAMIHASKIGFKIAEVDIVMTADNEFVCMHDTQYNNKYFTNPDGSALASPVNVNSLTLAQAQSQFLQKSSIAKFRKPVQTVDEYLETCSRYGLEPYIEVKQMNIAQAERLANKAKKFFASEGVMFISFDQSHLTALNNFGNFKLGLLTFTSSNALIDQVKALGSNFFVGVPHNTLTQEIKDYADAKNVLVYAWTITLNTQLNGNLSKGVRFIATDDMPPIHGAKGTVFKAYSSGLNFNDFILNNAVVNGGVLELQAGGSAEFTFDVGAKNIAFLSDIIGQGNFTYTLYVAGSAIDSVQVSSTKDIQAKLNKLAVSTAAIGLFIQATSISKISDLSFEVVEVFV